MDPVVLDSRVGLAMFTSIPIPKGSSVEVITHDLRIPFNVGVANTIYIRGWMCRFAGKFFMMVDFTIFTFVGMFERFE